jgi:hypothetical protein
MAAAAVALVAGWRLSRGLARVAPAPSMVVVEAEPSQGLGTDGGPTAGSSESRVPRSFPTLAVLDGQGAPVSGCAVELRVPGQTQEEAVQAAASVCDAVQLGAVAPGDYLVSAEAPGFRRSERPVRLGTGRVALRLSLEDGPLLAGHVLDAQGRPVPGVSVALSPTHEVAHSDDAGVFRLSVPGPGLYSLEAHHSDYGGAVSSVSVPTADVVLQLQPRSILQLKVVSSGQPVPGAQVLLFDGRDSGPGGQYEADSPTDAAGTLRLLGFPPGAYTLGVMRPGALSASRQRVVLREGVTTAVTVTLPARPVGTIEGEVVDGAGGPVEGAWVRAQPFEVPPVQSDAQGRFRLLGVPDGVEYQVAAVLETATSPSRPARAGDTGVRLSVSRTRRYRGRVLDASHAPVAAFSVGEVEVAAEDGRFSVAVPARGDTVSFSVEAPGLARATVVRPAEVQEVGDVVLVPAPAVHGVVREANGAPAVGALVVCEGCRGEGVGERRLTAVTNAQGRFTLYVTAAYGVLVRLVAMKDGQLGWAEAGRAGEQALLTLASPSTVRGRVLHTNGKPAAGVAVVFAEPLLEPLLLVSGTDGTFSGEVPPGLYQVTLSPDASQPRRTWTVQLPVDHPLELSVSSP